MGVSTPPSSIADVAGRAFLGTGASGMVLLGLVVVLSRVAPGLGTLLLSVAGALLLVPHAAFTWLRAWRTGGGPALVVGTGTAAAAY